MQRTTPGGGWKTIEAHPHRMEKMKIEENSSLLLLIIL
jgi:hypothetical protein